MIRFKHFDFRILIIAILLFALFAQNVLLQYKVYEVLKFVLLTASGQHGNADIFFSAS